MKLLTVIFPAYNNPAYAGATPTPYDRRAKAKMEAEFMKLGTMFRELQGMERAYVGEGGHPAFALATRYTLVVKDDKLVAADIVSTVVDHLGVKVEDILILGDV